MLVIIHIYKNCSIKKGIAMRNTDTRVRYTKDVLKKSLLPINDKEKQIYEQ